MKRIVAILLAVLVGLPSTAFPAAMGGACPMPQATRAESCSSCAPAVPPPQTVPMLSTDCCRFLPTPENVSQQAGSIETTPRPLRLLDIAASLPMIDGVSISTSLAVGAQPPRDLSPPHASPARTTHLLL